MSPEKFTGFLKSFLDFLEKVPEEVSWFLQLLLAPLTVPEEVSQFLKKFFVLVPDDAARFLKRFLGS